MTQHLNYLEVAVTQDKVPVTYRLLSRKADINVNAAKKLLYQFVSTTEHNVSATYCITGEALTNASGNEPTQTIRLVDAEDLEDARKQFKIITGIHIYSVQPSRLKDHSILVTANSDIPKCSLSDLARFGMIQDSEITVSESRAPAPPSVPQPKPVVNKTASTPASASVPKPVPRTTQTKESIAKQAKPEKNSVASIFGSLQANKTKPVAKPTAKPIAKPVAKPNPAPLPESPSARKTKKIQSDSDEDEDDDEEMDRRLAVSALQAQSAEDFWKDEDDEVKSAAPAKPETEEKKPSPNNQQVKGDTDIAEEAKESTKVALDAAPGERRRLKRKILRKKHYKDEKGFLVTEDVYDWESYSEDETTPPVLKRKAPPASPSKTDSKKPARKSGPADQKSLLSFWGKK